MKVFVKVLSGQEITLEVDGSQQISSVKKMVEERLKVPFDQQRLVFRGSTLANASSLDDNRILENSKLHLFIKKTAAKSTHHDAQTLWPELRKFLHSHFSEPDADAVLKNFKEDFKSTLEKLSLDDLERMGQYHLERNSKAPS